MARGWGTPSCARGLTSNAVIFQLVQTDGVKKEIRGCEERHCDGAVDGYRAEARTCALGWCGRYQGSPDTPNTRASRRAAWQHEDKIGDFRPFGGVLTFEFIYGRFMNARYRRYVLQLALMLTGLWQQGCAELGVGDYI